MRAAIGVAYGPSLRPGEYLMQADDTPLEKQINASDCFFVFDDDECINVCDPHLYPVGKHPSYFLCMFRKLKNSRRSGSGGPRAVGAKTDLTSEGFCCVKTSLSTSNDTRAAMARWLWRLTIDWGYHGRTSG